MKNIYTGKKNSNSEIEICRVIDTCIATGCAEVYNRNTDRIEYLTINERHSLYTNVQKLAEDTESEYHKKLIRAMRNGAEVESIEADSRTADECEMYGEWIWEVRGEYGFVKSNIYRLDGRYYAIPA